MVQYLEELSSGEKKLFFVGEQGNITFSKTSSLTYRYLRWLSYKGLRELFFLLFLPAGFPDSVTEDYIEFQIYDTIQASSSYLRGILCSRSVLIGAGMESDSASATSAALMFMFRDVMGMLGGIVFAQQKANAFGRNVKQWRLFADCINNVGLTLDLLSGLLPQEHFLWVICIGNLCRGMCGIAAGATRLAITTHFARKSNMTDVSSKEGIQETFVTVTGMLLGFLYTKIFGESTAMIWMTFLILTFVHVWANYKAVSALRFRTLNRERLYLLLVEFCSTSKILSIKDANEREGIFWQLHSRNGGIVFGGTVGQCQGGALKEAVEKQMGDFLIVPARTSILASREVVILLKDGCGDRGIVDAFAKAMTLDLDVDKFLESLEGSEWVTEHLSTSLGLLETRIRVCNKDL